MKRLLFTLVAGITSLSGGNKSGNGLGLLKGGVKDRVSGAMHQPNFALIDGSTQFIFDTYLPLQLNSKTDYYFQHGEAFSNFISCLYSYCFKLPHKERQGDFIRAQIGMPLSIYLENLPLERFNIVYESMMSVPPETKKTQTENAKAVVERVMDSLYLKFQNHMTGDFAPDITASNSSTSLAQTGEGGESEDADDESGDTPEGDNH